MGTKTAPIVIVRTAILMRTGTPANMLKAMAYSYNGLKG